jgi:hypothetical protein
MSDPSTRLKDALEKLGIVTVVDSSFVPDRKQIRLLCRVSNEGLDGASYTAVSQAWLSVIDAILIEEERLVDELEDIVGEDEEEQEVIKQLFMPPWNVHICKHYMRREGRLVFGWNFTVQANTDDVSGAVSDVCRLLMIMSRNIRSVISVPYSELSVVAPASASASVKIGKSRAIRQDSEEGRTIPGVGESGTVVDGFVVDMPLVGVTAQRNAPQAPILTPGVGGRGRLSGVSSRGAHLFRGK